jgi:hypothetical protein
MTTTPERRWFQFSLQDAFVGMTIAAIGLGGFAYVWRRASDARDIPIPLLFGLWYGLGALTGAGLFMPVKNAALGALLGFVLTCALMTLFAPM